MFGCQKLTYSLTLFARRENTSWPLATNLNAEYGWGGDVAQSGLYVEYK